MARKSREEELASILSPLAMEILRFLESIDAGLDMDQTIRFLTFVKSKGSELSAASAAREARNGASL